MIFRTVATTAALALLLAVVGSVAGPQWDPEPIDEHVQPATADTTIGASEGTTPVRTYEVEETSVVVQLDGAEVDGVIREPVDGPDSMRGVVFVHGAGTGDSATAFAATATRLASAGIVTLVPSKRLDTYSTRHRDYVAMADDYSRSVDLLRTWPGVEPDGVGVYGESEGGWIAPVMAAEDPDLAFTVLASSPVVKPREQGAFAADAYLRNTGVPEQIYRAIPRAVGMVLPGGGFEYVDFDVRPYQRQMTQPVLMVYGTADASMPVEQGPVEVADDLAVAGNSDLTVRYYEDADHGIRVDGEVSGDFSRDLAAWVGGLPQTADAPPHVAGAQPDQQYLASAVPTPRWLASGELLLVLVVLGFGLVLLGPAIWVVYRIARGRAARPQLSAGLRGPLWGVGAGAVATFVALIVYVVEIARLALDYERNAVVVQGGWIGVRVLGIVTLVAGAILINRIAALRSTGAVEDRVGRSVEIRDGAPMAAGPVGYVVLWSTLAGSVLLLVLEAYWGVYQLGI
ncbi:Alpha/beta hydrolase family protein [Paraoerskovia marina]|uniref:Alpha/beta hydrolase family protein n=1 Tax=Paraoerskovia marina TaxID=545619 RepID=A0A1H1RVZ0_9CELL|nr:prolyl oligopeptidase family serine peptidase [Paraoerskovia marina]SDS39900.1 Alpha/beta hydrolase family protein [Paraoerskovia marina]